MFLQELELQNFRCFKQSLFQFIKPATIVIGNNGVGKTTLIEAIYYLCYFKSFRASTIKELIHVSSDSFFLKGNFYQNKDLTDQHVLQVGYSAAKKSIKLDQKPVLSYKDVLTIFQVVTLTENDIDLINGAPVHRRAFIDQAVLMSDLEVLPMYRQLRQIVAHRNAILSRFSQSSIDPLEFEVWTQKLWDFSALIQAQRCLVISQIQDLVNQFLKQYFDEIYSISINYEAKNRPKNDDFEDFWIKNETLFNQEKWYKRSLFGAHLDDLVVHIESKKARIFASRGQQKLIILLCKLALTCIDQTKQYKPLFLMDDFISDFDAIRLKNLMNFFTSCQNQVIITAPIFDENLKKIAGILDPDLLLI